MAHQHPVAGHDMQRRHAARRRAARMCRRLRGSSHRGRARRSSPWAAPHAPPSASVMPGMSAQSRPGRIAAWSCGCGRGPRHRPCIGMGAAAPAGAPAQGRPRRRPRFRMVFTGTFSREFRNQVSKRYCRRVGGAAGQPARSDAREKRRQRSPVLPDDRCGRPAARSGRGAGGRDRGAGDQSQIDRRSCRLCRVPAAAPPWQWPAIAAGAPTCALACICPKGIVSRANNASSERRWRQGFDAGPIVWRRCSHNRLHRSMASRACVSGSGGGGRVRA